MRKGMREKLDAPPPPKEKALRRPGMKKAGKDVASLLPAAADVPEAGKREVIALERMMVLRVKGLTYKEIAAVCKCSEVNVFKRLDPYRETLAGLKDFQEQKAEIYDVLQSRVLGSIDDYKLRKANLFDTIRSAGQLEEMARKIRGLDMNKNVNIFSITVKAAYPAPDKGGPRGAIIEGKLGSSLEELSGGVRGAGISADVRQEDLPEMPRDGEPGELGRVEVAAAEVASVPVSG